MTLASAVVVTGGGSGIGKATVLECAARGASVAVLDFVAAAADEVAAQAKDAGAPDVVGVACDVRDEASVAAAVDEAASRLGALRGLVACAGIDRGGPIHELDLERWNDVISTNLTGTFLSCKYVVQKMLEQGDGGSIVCASSPWAVVSSPDGCGAYCASKGGVSSFVRAVALDYAPNRIRVNAIVPGATDTPLMWANTPASELDAARAEVANAIPWKRMAEPAEIAKGIVWLLSDDAAYVTGSHLTMDGGLLAIAGIST